MDFDSTKFEVSRRRMARTRRDYLIAGYGLLALGAGALTLVILNPLGFSTDDGSLESRAQIAIPFISVSIALLFGVLLIALSLGMTVGIGVEGQGIWLPSNRLIDFVRRRRAFVRFGEISGITVSRLRMHRKVEIRLHRGAAIGHRKRWILHEGWFGDVDAFLSSLPDDISAEHLSFHSIRK